jgi:hypothetical protein
MYRLYFLTAFLLILSLHSFSEDFIVNTDPEGMTLRMTTEYLRIAEDGMYDVTVPIKLEIENSLTFISLTNPQNGFPWLKAGDHKLLALYNNGYLILYAKDTIIPVFELTSEKTIDDGNSFIFKSSSFLSEGLNVYFASNLGKTSIHCPYSEGVKGPGINETITIQAKDPNKKITGFYLSNGYVSFDKPYLYELNNRIKNISISSSDGKHIGDYDLMDTPLLQYIYLKTESNTIIITIKDIYPGKKYDDTCLNFISLTAWY